MLKVTVSSPVRPRDQRSNATQQEALGRFESNIFDERFDFAYLSIPKAANTSIKIALIPTVGLAPEDEVNGRPARTLVHDKINGPFEYRSRAYIAERPVGFVFSAVRNTWERIASCWYDKVVRRFHVPFAHYGFEKGMPFTGFVGCIAAIEDERAEVHFRSQLTQLYYRRRFLPDVVFRTEQLAAQWPRLQAWFAGRHGTAIGHLPSANRSGRAPAREIYDAASREFVRNRYEEEIGFFGFTFPT